MSENKVPQIRFKGFSGKWEEKRLVDISESFEYGLNVSATKYDGKNKYIRITDINEDSHKFNIDNLTSPNVNLSLLENYKLNFGDILFARTGASVGKTYIYKKEDGLVYFAGFLIRSRIKKEINAEFVFQNTLTKKYYKFIKFTSQRSGQPGVNALEYSNYKIFIPKINEQTKIGNYFQKLDKLIEQKQIKHQKLKQLKKGSLAKMFPKNGADTPEIRFKGFSGKWEEKSLSELTEYKNGKGHEDKQAIFGKYELINLNSISIDGGLKHSGKFIDETESTLDENDLVMVLSDVGHGDLLGRVALIPENNKFVLNQRVALLKPFNNIIPQFLFYNITVNQKYFKMQGAGMSQLNISKSSVEGFISYIPSDLEEQTKIGNYFQKLDKQIDLQLQELEKLKNIKKASLDKMFV